MPYRTETSCGTSEIEAERGPEQSGEPEFGDIRELASLTEAAHREGVSPEGLGSLSYLADPFEEWHTKSDLGYPRRSVCAGTQLLAFRRAPKCYSACADLGGVPT